MTARPSFAEIKSYQEFAKYYWYRNELVQLCKLLGIASTGMKIELQRNIEAYFNGAAIPGKKAQKRVKSTITNLSPDTKLL